MSVSTSVPSLLLGIDPGLSGALALYDPVTEILSIWDMPVRAFTLKSGKKRREIDARRLAVLLDNECAGRDVRACIEKVGAMPGQGVTSMFTFGRAVGTVEGVLAHMGVDPVYVAPQKWQKHQGVREGGKDAHRMGAILRWGPIDYFSRKRDDGRADAALILAWFMENLNG